MLRYHKHKFIFVDAQKTAGQSLTETLKKNVPDLEKLVTKQKHGSAITGRDILGVDKWNEYYKFAFVRNPWDRLVSWYSMILGICLDEKMSQINTKL
ncbi:MAG: sulfotransferase family protein [Okeania sp. SIO2F4]|uniref:sulfotransferase family 2 domain-containing protein n=1 Tax=Okeania sp. SIO2F4 TaxID=2607790 RepID=UPI001428DDDF|nr:sulfotransferase family 2 domain-containing protein [Okeania sp. SIO2F4]NES08461.1 sulfotransferase family protein [Okeania sp. SIO2F4]